MATGSDGIESGRHALFARLRRTARTYSEQIGHDGGWGLTLDQVSSLVNTAEVLAILETGGFDYEHECVQRGLGYLTRELAPQLENPDRGQRTRYVAFALLGLTEYPQARARDDVRDCIEFGVEWLATNNRIDGGWASKAKPRELSLFATCTAIGALARAAPSHTVVQEGADCLIANSLTAATWPVEVNRRDRPSPAITGLAALALFDAGRQRPAKAITRRLTKNTHQWATRTEEARGELGTHWRHMTFSICARALLRGGLPIFDPRLRPALRYVDTLWSPREELWSDGDPDGHFTVRGAYAAALLAQEARRSIGELDPLSLAETLEPEGVPLVATNPTTLEIDTANRRLVLKGIDGRKHTIELSDHLFSFAEAIYETGPIEPKALCRRLGVQAPDIHGMFAKLNLRVHFDTNGVVGKFIQRKPNGQLFIAMQEKPTR